jgi:hypothetical protein
VATPAHHTPTLEIDCAGLEQCAAGWGGSGMCTARLAMLPGLTHYNIASSPTLAATVTPFLDVPVSGDE